MLVYTLFRIDISLRRQTFARGTRSSCDGEEDVGRRRQSFAMHASRRDSRISRGTSVTGGPVPIILREENEHSIS